MLGLFALDLTQYLKHAKRKAKKLKMREGEGSAALPKWAWPNFH